MLFGLCPDVVQPICDDHKHSCSSSQDLRLPAACSFQAEASNCLLYSPNDTTQTCSRQHATPHQFKRAESEGNITATQQTPTGCDAAACEACAHSPMICAEHTAAPCLAECLLSCSLVRLSLDGLRCAPCHGHMTCTMQPGHWIIRPLPYQYKAQLLQARKHQACNLGHSP